MNNRIVMRMAIVAILLALTANLWAADWPQYGGTDCRNMVSDEKGLPDAFSPPTINRALTNFDLKSAKNVKWMVRLTDETFDSPVVAGGKLLLGMRGFRDDPKYGSDSAYENAIRGTLLCLDAATGKRIWRLNLPWNRMFNSNLVGTLGICSTPTVEGDRVYVMGNQCDVLCLDLNGRTGGNHGSFTNQAVYCGKFATKTNPVAESIAQDATDGKILWRYDIQRDLHINMHDAASACILVHDDLLYVTSGNGVTGAHQVSATPDAPSLLVLDKHTGVLVGADDEKIGRHVFHGEWSSPSLGVVNGKPLVLFGGGDGYCYAFDPIPVAGKLCCVWKFNANYGNTNVYGGGRGKSIPNSPSEVLATPVCVKDRIYMTTGQDWTHGPGPTNANLWCVDATQTGDISEKGRIWQYSICRSDATPSVADGLVYVTDFKGNVHCVDAETGKPYWVFDAGAPVWCSTLVADGKVYFGNSKGKFFILAAGRKLKTLCEADVASAMCSSPIVANGTLYIATYRHLFAISEK